MPHTYTIREQADGSETITQIAANGRSYKREANYGDFAKALAEEGEPRITRIPYVAPAPAPEPTPAELLAQTDQELLSISARTIEDIIQERIDSGKFVAETVKGKIAERKALRAQL